MEKEIIEQFKLPKYIKGKTFAEASKAINDKFKDRNDKISKDTRNELLMRLAKAQESIKQEQGIDNPSEQMFFGGDIPKEGVSPTGIASTAFDLASPFIKDGVGKSAASGAVKGASAGMALGPLGAIGGGLLGGAAGLIQGNEQKDAQQDALNTAIQSNNSKQYTDFANGGPTDPDPRKLKTNFFKDPFAYDEFNVGLDTNFEVPPLSQLRNPRVNTNESGKRMPGLQANPLISRKQIEPEKNYGDFLNDVYPSTIGDLDSRLIKEENSGFNVKPLNFSDSKIGDAGSVDVVGGIIGRRPGKGSGSSNPEVTNDDSKVRGQSYRYAGEEPTMGGDLLTSLPTSSSGEETGLTPEQRRAKIKEMLGKAKGIGTDILRYAPAIANAKQLADLEKPGYESLDRMGNRYEKDLVDEQALRNNVQQQYDNTRRALTNASAGDAGALRSNLLGAQLNANQGTSQALMQAENINRGENRAEQQFNARIDQTNLRQDYLENDINARNKGAYETNKSRLTSQLGNDLGNIGKEEKFKQMVKDMGICYDTRGRYICGTEERVPNDYKGDVEDNAYGGMTNDDLFSDYLSKVLAKKRNS